jgi:hypothetical protein
MNIILQLNFTTKRSFFLAKNIFLKFLNVFHKDFACFYSIYFQQWRCRTKFFKKQDSNPFLPVFMIQAYFKNFIRIFKKFQLYFLICALFIFVKTFYTKFCPKNKND